MTRWVNKYTEVLEGSTHHVTGLQYQRCSIGNHRQHDDYTTTTNALFSPITTNILWGLDSRKTFSNTSCLAWAKPDWPTAVQDQNYSFKKHSQCRKSPPPPRPINVAIRRVLVGDYKTFPDLITCIHTSSLVHLINNYVIQFYRSLDLFNFNLFRSYFIPNPTKSRGLHREGHWFI